MNDEQKKELRNLRQGWRDRKQELQDQKLEKKTIYDEEMLNINTEIDRLTGKLLSTKDGIDEE
jgi:hypothetical protein